MQSINTVDLQKLMRTRSISKYHFQYRYVVLFETTRDYYATSASLSLTLSLTLSPALQSLQIVWIQKTSDVLPNQIRGKQTYQELISTLQEYNFWYWLRADAYDTLGTFISQKKQKFKQVRTTNLVFFMHAVRRFMLEFIEIVILFFMQTHEKETQLDSYV